MNVLENWLVLPKSCLTESNLRLCEAQALILRFGLNVHFKLAGDSHEYAVVDKGSSILCLEFLLGGSVGIAARVVKSGRHCSNLPIGLFQRQTHGCN
jgi:hypothetical protein